MEKKKQSIFIRVIAGVFALLALLLLLIKMSSGISSLATLGAVGNAIVIVFCGYTAITGLSPVMNIKKGSKGDI